MLPILPAAPGHRLLHALLAAVWLGFALTRELAPVTVAEFHRHPDARVSASAGLLWRRQSWYLPYLMVTLVVAALVTCAIVLGRLRPGLVGRPGLEAVP